MRKNIQQELWNDAIAETLCLWAIVLVTIGLGVLVGSLIRWASGVGG